MFLYCSPQELLEWNGKTPKQSTKKSKKLDKGEDDASQSIVPVALNMSTPSSSQRVKQRAHSSSSQRAPQRAHSSSSQRAPQRDHSSSSQRAPQRTQSSSAKPRNPSASRLHTPRAPSSSSSSKPHGRHSSSKKRAPDFDYGMPRVQKKPKLDMPKTGGEKRSRSKKKTENKKKKVPYQCFPKGMISGVDCSWYLGSNFKRLHTIIFC